MARHGSIDGTPMDEQYGPYLLRQRVGLGGTAEVWLAERPEDPSGPVPTVAIKRLQPEMRIHEEVCALFAAEGDLLSRFDHPNIVAALDVGSIADRPYICMEFADRGDLAVLLRGGALPAGVAVRIALDLCAALEHVHAAEVVHSDVNPGNVLLSAAGRVRLCDFGVAATDHGGKGAVRGTYAYMAPEQARGEEIDARCDVFALGATMWEMLSGRRLFQRDAPYLTLTAVVEAPTPALSHVFTDLAAEVASRLDGITARALAKEAGERYQSVAELAADIRAAATSLGLDLSAEHLVTLLAARPPRPKRA
jgi:eukaryotic-like serine/threonine-protein kinase